MLPNQAIASTPSARLRLIRLIGIVKALVHNVISVDPSIAQAGS
jgi:hypothetical protein